MNKITSLLKTKEPYYALCCYILGGIMLHYGIMKMMLSQCMIVPFSVWRHPLESIPGGQLTWAFLGYSAWFQFLLGVLEFVPAVLLFFRRTSFIGGIVMLPATLGVFVVNRALHLWEFTHTLSAFLLLLNILIFVFEWARVKALVAIISGKEEQYAASTIWTVIKVVALLVISVTFGVKRYNFGNIHTEFAGDWRHNQPSEWTLEEEQIDGVRVNTSLFYAYFMPTETYSEFSSQTPNPRGFIEYDVDRAKHTIDFKWKRYEHNGGNLHHFKGKYHYSFAGDSILLISTMPDSAVLQASGQFKEPLHTWLLKKRVISRKNLTQ